MRISPDIVKLHRRQFIVGPRRFVAVEGWSSLNLSSSVCLSFCPELRLGSCKDADGVVWAVLGRAIESDMGKPEPCEAIARSRTTEVPWLRYSWAGRWLLVGNGAVYMDAAGLLGCFYGCARGECWASSSPALIEDVLSKTKVEHSNGRHLVYEFGVSWFPPPQSRIPSVHRLLPSQNLDLQTGTPSTSRLLPPIDPSRTTEDIVNMLLGRLTTVMQRLAESESEPLWLGLTAGYDSRLVLAIARSAGICVRPFTRIARRVSVGDLALPPRLAKQCAYDHVFLHLPADLMDRRSLVERHCAGYVSPGDAAPLTSGVRDDMQGTAIGGHLWAVANFAPFQKLSQVTPAPIEGAKQIAKILGEPPGSQATAGLQSWLAWVHETPLDHLDWRDRLYIEQRLAGWLSSKEQLYDVALLERFPILNSASTYALILSVDYGARRESALQLALIKHLAPDLLQFPFNPPDWRFINKHPVHAARRFLMKSAQSILSRLPRS